MNRPVSHNKIIICKFKCTMYSVWVTVRLKNRLAIYNLLMLHIYPLFLYIISETSSPSGTSSSSSNSSFIVQRHLDLSAGHPPHRATIPKLPSPASFSISNVFNPWYFFLGVLYAVIIFPSGCTICSWYNWAYPSRLPIRRANSVPASAIRRVSSGWDSAHSNLARKSDKSTATGM